MRVTLLSSVTAIAQSDWDNLVGRCYPFMRYGFFLALEQGGSIGQQRGWLPQYAVVYDDSNRLIAIMPWFKKTHSYGEYLFDWAFAEAFERYGLRYYPKLINAIPFTPCQGPRLAVAKGINTGEVLMRIEAALAKAHDVSNIQCLYVESDFSAVLEAQGWWQRFDIQFLWQNRSYRCFDDFLATLVSRKRKSIRKERRQVTEQNIELRTLHGEELDAEFWQQLSVFYQRTYLKRSGHGGYLTPTTLRLWGEQLTPYIVVFAAYQDGILVAASLCFKGSDTLYGRYWGCRQELEFLHFEACYYQGIDYCIKQGLRYFDAGAQGEHKLHRGFEPVLREGFYRFAESPLNDAIADYCLQERRALREHLHTLHGYTPYKQPDQ
ncbi:GNAT family N-acetyltransferase [Idiomarina aquatica]|uniref:GNAT family N-acetyltransferase n=1 Tax=Idiomarina aquatica TaxID=1327752 RepID=A0AA94EEV1_9GAMM|nr:GNAT family N-acetyltransferase [Idiomarina aquatica]RUO40380.1 GNAT family N-acetyltransferase [Idiomarina aquatica]